MRGIRKNKVIFNMGLKPALKNEASGGSQNCTLESSCAAVQFARDSSGENRDLQRFGRKSGSLSARHKAKSDGPIFLKGTAS